MFRARSLKRYVRDLFRGRQMAREIDDELQFHVEALVGELTARGESPEEARRIATRRFGRLDIMTDEARHAKGVGLFDDLRQDVRHGLRTLARQRSFTAACVVTLALGIGATTTIFSVVDAILFRPLPYPDANRVVMVFLRDAALGLERGRMGDADFLALNERQRTFESVAAATSPDNGFTWTSRATPEQVRGSSVTAAFFSVLAVRPMLGRAFLSGDDRPGRPLTVVVSRRFWHERLQHDPAVIGRHIILNQRDHVVIGVMPPDFHVGPRDEDEIWPILQLEEPRQRQPYYLAVVARLKQGTSEMTAAADATRIAVEVGRQYPRSNRLEAIVVQMQEALVGDARASLLALFGAVTLVLLIAVVNVANLQVARGAARQKEVAIRFALGARWLRVVRQLVTESLLLGAAGGALGLALAWCALRGIVALGPTFVPRMSEVSIDGRVLVFTAATAFVSAVLFGLAPALGARALRVAGSFDRSGGGSTSAGGTRFLRDALVVTEFSLALVLLVGAGLLVRSFLRLQGVNPGFSPDHVVTMQMSLPGVHYRQASQVASFYDQLLQATASGPGVQAAAIAMSLPPNLLQAQNPFHLEGQSYEPDKATNLAEEIPISEDYFRALGVPLVAGRFFDSSDRLPGHHALIINQAMAGRYFPGVDAVGRRVQTGDANPGSTWETIVGVVGNVKYQGLNEKEQPTMYVPYHADGWNPWFVRSMYIVVRTRSAPADAAAAVRRALHSLDPNIPLANIHTMDELLSESVRTPRFRTVLLGSFAVLAVVLAAIGIYGVLAYSVARRTHEIGVRLALGARPNDVLRLVLRQGAGLALAGVGIGLALSLALTRAMSKLLFDVSPTDPLTFAGVAVLLTLVALLGSLVPARRATRVDPIAALRCE